MTGATSHAETTPAAQPARAAARPWPFSCAPWPEAIAAHSISDWLSLAHRAVDPNPFFELWHLHPALERFNPDATVRLAQLTAAGEFRGAMPITRSNSYYGRLIPHLSTWLHDNAFCGQPLVAEGNETEFWNSLLAWADTNAKTAVFLHLSHMASDSPLVAALREICDRESRPAVVVHEEDRAMLGSSLDAETYLAEAMSGKKRKELRRQFTRLSELGDLRFLRSESAEGVERWTDDFLRLEASGWKGRNGSALAVQPKVAAYFRDAMHAAAQAGRLERLSLELDGKPIAMLATLLSSPGAFAFKTAFDENYARYSPGVLLQRENLALLERDDIAWCDSCAAADHPMIERIWRQHRTMLRINVAIGGAVRRAIAAPLFRIEGRRQLSEVAK